MKVYAVYDMAAGAYLPPFFQKNDLMAVRLFEGTVNDGQSLFWQSPSDFSLHGLGEFDEENGTFTTDGPPRPIRSALALVSREVNSAQAELPVETKELN